MKSINANLSPEQASKQLKQFAIAGVACSAVGLLVFWWLGGAGLAFGARAIILSSHQANKSNKDVQKFTVLAIMAVVLGLIDVVLFSLSK